MEQNQHNLNENQLRLCKTIISGLGGTDNITALDCCATRLRIDVTDINITNSNYLNKCGCKGILYRANSIQLVFGTRVGEIHGMLTKFIPDSDEIFGQQ